MLGRWLTLRPVERTYVGLDEIAPTLPLAVMTSEDSRFCQHGGVDWDALRDVIDAADEDGPARGASTIPMQTAKNLFLWPSRSYVRKGLELPDRALSRPDLVEAADDGGLSQHRRMGRRASSAPRRPRSAISANPPATSPAREAALLAARPAQPAGAQSRPTDAPGIAPWRARSWRAWRCAAPLSDCLQGPRLQADVVRLGLDICRNTLYEAQPYRD